MNRTMTPTEAEVEHRVLAWVLARLTAITDSPELKERGFLRRALVDFTEECRLKHREARRRMHTK